MVTHFPSPVLSVAVDVVKDLDGGDALSGLWTLFTKCKESLKDGRRLENISWRLWYRELAAHHSSPPLSPHSYPASPDYLSDPAPLSPTSDSGRSRPDGALARASPSLQCSYRSLSSPDPPLHSPSRSDRPSFSSASSHSRPLSLRTKSTSSVGQIILDMTHSALDVAPQRLDPAPASLKSVPVDAPERSSPPTPEPDVILAPFPTVIVPSTPPHPAALSTMFPRVVVVNPTPHPTPPATPVPAAPPSLTLATGQMHLVPPSRSPANLSRASASAAAASSRSAGPPPALLPAAPAPSIPAKRNDETLKPSDRRFFLQQDQSPSPERDSSDARSPREARDGSQGSVSTGKSPSDAGDLLPSSLASNHTKASTSSRPGRAARAHRKAHPTTTARPAHRFQAQRSHPLVQRKAAGTEQQLKGSRPMFDVGSVTSDGSKATGDSSLTRAQAVQAEKPRPSGSRSRLPSAPSTTAPIAPAPPPARPAPSHSSSEYETTTDTEDDSWASDDEDEPEPSKEEIRLREAALEAQRQRELFVKQPKRSYSNLNRTQSGLLSALLNPDPNVLPSGHPLRNASSPDVTRGFQPVRPPIPAALTSSPSSTALPQVSNITARAPSLPPSQPQPQPPPPQANGGYRPKGRPQGQEMEEETDTEDENPDDSIQVSRSLAQQKLAALVDPTRRRHSDRAGGSEAQVRPVLPSVATAPIPFNHPWNLPAPAPPMTPRTTRRQMLSTELSESLRRNLLWERQVSKTNLLGNGGRRGGVLGGGLRPLTSTTTTTVHAHGSAEETERPGQSQRGENSRSGDEEDPARAERKRQVLARNRSWADDYHYAGW
ncbi:hypothetical protein OF83DRAFT_1245957 [Amylostereum chailletii]|nr:hypothetical protein OF83DRAFT_1245957 [Amylostereum chailletii]